MSAKYPKSRCEDKPSLDPAWCDCGKHCKIRCPYFRTEMMESQEVCGWCLLHDTHLAKDHWYLRCARVVFFRVRECRLAHYRTPTKEQCQALN